MTSRSQCGRAYSLASPLGHISNARLRPTQLSTAVQETKVRGVPVRACGSSRPDPVVVLSAPTMPEVIQKLAEEADIVLLASPPILAAADAAILAPMVDSALLVVRTQARREAVQAACQQLANVKARLIGAVMNRTEQDGSHYYHRTPSRRGEREVLLHQAPVSWARGATMYQEIGLDLLRGFDPLAVSPLARDRSDYYSFKRALDLTMAALALVILLPCMALIAVLIVIDSPGPIIYIQKRVGARRWSREDYAYWKQSTFNFYKFRTMVWSANPSVHQAFVKAFIKGHVETSNPGGTEFKLTKDPRVTRLGRILRKTSLDELPQLVNVLKGDMSLVGPRPALPYEVELYDEWHKRRFQALPGITGWWQVRGRSRVTFDEMVRMDRYYIEHQSLGLDLKILLLTPWEVIACRGAA